MNVSKEVEKHYMYYLLLFGTILFCITALINSSYNRPLQMVIVVMTAFFYIALALIHHFIEHDLTAKIVVEYILIGALGIALFAFLLNGVL